MNVARWEEHRQLEVARQAQASTIRVSRFSPGSKRATIRSWRGWKGGAKSKMPRVWTSPYWMRCHNRWVAMPQTLFVRQAEPKECKTIANTQNGSAWNTSHTRLALSNPLYIFVADDTTIVSQIEFDFRHGDTVVSLALQETKHQETVA